MTGCGAFPGEYALAMIDIDNLKQINDRFGHPPGDTAIYHTAQAIRAILRSQDELVRYGQGMSSCCCSTVCRRISCGAS